jgi:hypothetical protein
MVDRKHQMVTDCVEALCKCGCNAVRATISAMERGLPVPQTEGLTEQQREFVLSELKAIMAVYDKH